MCGLILTALIAGAVEVQPGVMEVQYFPPTVDILRGTSIETMTISTEEYLDCTDFSLLR